MAYEKQTWTTGDVITQEKLNHMEDGIALDENYEKQTWSTGDVITAEKLNHMEDGIGNAGGGGDWSFAEVTFMAQWTAQEGLTSYVIHSPSILNDVLLCRDVEVWSHEPQTLQIPLYKGSIFLSQNAFTDVDFSSSPALSGDVTFSDRTFVITGDCTITLKGAE